MKFNWKVFADVAQIIVPPLLAVTPLAPIAPAIAQGISDARSLVHASNTDKLAYVQQIALDATNGVNAQAGRVILDPALVAAISAGYISNSYQLVKMIHASHTSEIINGDNPATTKAPAAEPAKG